MNSVYDRHASPSWIERIAVDQLDRPMRSRIDRIALDRRLQVELSQLVRSVR
ncbi:MAG: hypothetical protein H0V96_08455 [Acidimicrobiia bacterium]|nr:hypothetical protein [Acidimicrobiia bacterium]